MTPSSETPIKGQPRGAAGHRATAGLALTTLLALYAFACASPPGGPPFRPATAPAADQSLVYVYRTQSLGGISAFDLQLDSQDVGELADGQYLSFTLTPGRHVLSARLRFLALFPRAWNQLEFVVGPGQSVFIATWANYKHHDDPAAPIRAETGGGGTGSVGVFIAERDPIVAALELPAMRRAVGR